MQINGMVQEAQQVDERLFSSWIEDHLHQVRSAIDQGYYQEALQYIQHIRQSLEMLCGLSPLITTYELCSPSPPKQCAKWSVLPCGMRRFMHYLVTRIGKNVRLYLIQT